jgi:hypothetical protein
VKQAEEKERKKKRAPKKRVKKREKENKSQQNKKKKKKRVNGTRDLGVRFGERLMGMVLEAFWYVIYGPPPVISQFLWLII